MNLLAIDTATPDAVVYLLTDKGDPVVVRNQETKRADDLLQIIDQVLNKGSIALSELTGILVRRGLGSYTGLRVGLTVAKALGWSEDLPVWGISLSKERPLEPAEIKRAARNKLVAIRHKTGFLSWQSVVPKYQRYSDP